MSRPIKPIKLIILPIIVLIIVAGAFNVCQADYAKIISSEDTYVWSSSPNGNYGSASSLEAGCDSDGNPTYYALIKFDINQIIGKAIANATLNVYVSAGSNSYGGELRVYRITSPWNESTVTWNTRPDFNSTPIASIPLPSSSDFNKYIRIDVTDELKYFSDHPSEFHGWLIWFENPGLNAYIYIQSREATNKPYLEVYFADPKIVTETMTTTVTETETTTTMMTKTETATTTTWTTVIKTETIIIEKKPPAILQEEEEEETGGFLMMEESDFQIDRNILIVMITILSLVFAAALIKRWT